MSQISPPIRIVLVAAVAFLAAWMFFLRPKAEEVPPPAPAASTAVAKQPGNTAQSGPGKVVQAAENAAATAGTAAKASAGEATSTPAATTAAPTTAKAPAAKPAVSAAQKLGVDATALNSLPRDVRAAIVARKIVVLGFFNPEASDDRATKKQLEKVWKFHGRVAVHAAPISAVQRYQVITRGVDVSQSPSIVVIDRNRKAQLLAGFVDHIQVEQAIVDAMRRSGMAVVKTHYLRQVNALCGTYVDNLFVSTEPGTGATIRSYLRDNKRVAGRFTARLRALSAPAGYRSFKSGIVGDLHVVTGYLAALDAAVKAKSYTKVVSVVDHYEKPLTAAGKRFDKRARQHDMLACMYG
jgi:hypothetical protein